MRVPDQCIAQCLRTIAMALPLLLPSAVLYASPIIAIAKNASEQEVIAARELARYGWAITGDPLTIYRAESIAELNKSDIRHRTSDIRIFVIATAESPLARGLARQIPVVPDDPEGFSIGSFRSGKSEGLLILGRSPIACLYGVYHYLEYACGVGFFEDGDHIPRLSALPMEGVRFQEAPRFPERMAFAWMAWRTLKKNRSCLWNLEDWKRWLDWCAKNKYNMIRMDIHWAGLGAALAIYEDVIPGFKLDSSERAAYTPMWPSEYTLKLYKKVMRYGRSRGIRFFYAFDPSAFPPSAADALRRAYPNAQISRPDPAYPFQIHLLDRPSILDFLGKVVQKAIQVFGTDHLYYALFPTEQPFLGEYIPDFRPYYTNLMADIIVEVDPEARFYLDGWGLALSFQSARQLKEEYFDRLTHPFTVLSTYSHFPIYKDRFEYYMGHPWHYIEIDGFGHQDYWHTFTPYAELIERAKDVLTHPGSNCVGFSTLPEIVNYDPFYRTLIAKLAWDPWGVGPRPSGRSRAGSVPRSTRGIRQLADCRAAGKVASLEDFIAYFVRHRYSSPPANEPGLTKAWSLIAEAISDNRIHIDPYIDGYTLAYRNTALNLFPPVQMWGHLYVKWEDVRKLEEALRWLLQSLPAERENPLYQHDLADLFHLYASETCKFELLRLHSAYLRATRLFQQEREEQAPPLPVPTTHGREVEDALASFEESAQKMDELLGMIQQVWETRPELSIENDIREAMAVPGADPSLVRNIRAQARVFQNGSVEVMAACYRPEIQAVVENLRQRLARRETQLFPPDMVISYFFKPPEDSWGYPWLQVKEPDLARRLSEIHERFVSGQYDRPPQRPENTADVVALCFRRMGHEGLGVRAFWEAAAGQEGRGGGLRNKQGGTVGEGFL